MLKNGWDVTLKALAGTITVLWSIRQNDAPSAAVVATAVWTDTTAGDFTTALSVGKSLMNGVSLGTGLTINDLTTKTGYSLVATTGLGNQTANITGNLSGSVGSVTGAVGSVTGAVGSVTGAVGSVTGLTASDVGAIKTKTDSLTFTSAGFVDANVQKINDVTITGDGQVGTEFGV
jgi:hypothetical protein